MLNWISESEKLPKIAQAVLLMSPRQHRGFWDFNVARILVRFDGVVPRPVPRGSEWPVNYYWELGDVPHHNQLITGNSYWAYLSDLNLPPGAEHATMNGYGYVCQTGKCFVEKGPDTNGVRRAALDDAIRSTLPGDPDQ